MYGDLDKDEILTLLSNVLFFEIYVCIMPWMWSDMYLCVGGIDFISFYNLFYWILELRWQCVMFWFSFDCASFSFHWCCYDNCFTCFVQRTLCNKEVNKCNNKITELRAILQRESQNS
jgi:hypothetical protein